MSRKKKKKTWEVGESSLDLGHKSTRRGGFFSVTPGGEFAVGRWKKLEESVELEGRAKEFLG
jgi:hypothetical protein